MKIQEIKRNNFYTDGSRVIFKSKNGKNFYELTKSAKQTELFIAHGVDFAVAKLSDWKDAEVKKVEKDMILLDGEVKVLDSKNLEILSIKPKNAKHNSRGEVVNSNELIYDKKTIVVNISKYMF